MHPENFIYFLTACGFFLGLLYSIFVDLGPIDICLSAMLLSMVFYIIGLASTSFFIRFVDMQSNFNIDRKQKEDALDKIVLRLEKREKFIRDSHEFIENLEKEFLAQDEKKNKENQKHAY
jgi:hypothetical protein